MTGGVLRRRSCEASYTKEKPKEEGHGMTEAETGVRLLQAKEHQGLLETTRI